MHAKSDAEVLASGRRSSKPNVTLLRNAQAVKLETNAAGRTVTEVVVERDGEPGALAADIVVVSCGAANSAKLLLRSANDAHPNGLANGSDQVGRNYMFHNSQAVLALSHEPNPTVFQKTLGVNDFYFGEPGATTTRSGNIQMVGKSQAPMFRGEKPIETKLAPKWALDEDRRATPSTSGCRPRTCRAPTTGSRSPATAASGWRTRRPTRTPAKELYEQAQVDARRTWACTPTT